MGLNITRKVGEHIMITDIDGNRLQIEYAYRKGDRIDLIFTELDPTVNGRSHNFNVQRVRKETSNEDKS